MTIKERKEAITEALLPIWNETSEEIMYEIARTQINKLAKSKIDLDKILPLLPACPEFGLNAPLYVLGLAKMPTKGKQWMAGVYTEEFDIDPKEELEKIKNFLKSS